MRKPLIYYCISIFSGCLVSLVTMNNLYLGAALAASFLGIIFFTLNSKYFFIILCFFILGNIDYYIYFRINIHPQEYLRVRIINNKGTTAQGIFRNRKLQLRGNLYGASQGEILYVKGIFTAEPDYEKGVIGDYKIKSSKKGESDLIHRLYTLRSNIYEKYRKGLGERKAGIISAACFGDTSHLEDDQRTLLNKLGIIHIVSVSGLHMSLIYKVLEILAGYQLGILFSFIYVLFSGAQASTVRAFIMIVVLKLSSKFYKKYDRLSSLSLAAAVLLVWRPYYISDMGFMLSFLSVYGIITFFERLKKVMYRLPEALSSSISLTLSAQSFSAPYAMFFTRNFSPGFITGNLFLLPLYSLLVIAGNISLLFMNVDYIFSKFNFVSGLIITAIDGGTYILSRISPPIIYISAIQTWSIMVIYISYLLHKSGWRKALFLPLFFVIPLFFESYKFHPELNYINIYDRAAVIIRYKEESILIVDKLHSFMKRDKETMGIYRVDRIEIFNEEEKSIGLSDKYTIRLYKFFNDARKPQLAFEIITKEKKVLVTSVKIPDGSQFNNYDIIYLKADRTKKNVSNRIENIAVVKMFFGKVYVTS